MNKQTRAPWPKQKLDTICESISDGDHQAPPQVDSGVPFITISNFDQQNGIDFSNTKFVPEEYYNALDPKRKARPGDVLYSVVGSFGIPVLVKNDRPFAFQRHIAILRPNRSLLPEFLFYSMKTPAFFHQADGAAVGAAQRTIGLSSLRGFTLSLPPLSEQRRIVGILSAYDDLIENNRKRIALLEESARRLYKEWFGKAGRQGFGERQETRDEPIDARRETIDASLVSRLTSPRVSRLMSHAQFRVTTLGDICKTIGGGTPKTGVAEYWDGDIPWVVPTDITRNFSMALLDTERKITLAGLQNSSAKMLPARTILMTSRASVGYFGMADFPVCTNQGFISIIPNRDIWRWYLLFNLMSRVEEIRGKAKGSTFPEISKSSFRDMDIAIPSDDVLIGFNAFVQPVMKQVNTLARQSRTLATARDALLPRLMKGVFN